MTDVAMNHAPELEVPADAPTSDATPARVTLTDDELDTVAGILAYELAPCDSCLEPGRCGDCYDAACVQATTLLNSRWLRDRIAAREAAVRAQARFDVEAEYERRSGRGLKSPGYEEGYLDGLELAARIAGG